MGIFTRLPDELKQVDVIITGGGSAGCIVAARLSDADPQLSILVIESGPNNHNVPTIVHPALFVAHLAPDSKNTLVYHGKKSKHTADRDLIVHTGGTLGGGSSINAMIYTRGQRSDFDSWQVPGWGANDILPYMKKLETYHGPGSKDSHGHDGPIQISSGGFRNTATEADFIAAVKKVGWPEIEDLQGLDASDGANNGVQKALRYVSPDGKRQDVAHCYIHPRLQDGKHPNLHVLVESQVERVLFNDGVAVGVEYRPNPPFASDGEASVARTIEAKKLVVLSCGSLATPAILERSRIGRPEILDRAGIPTFVDLPGVGENYQDHQGVIYTYRASLDAEKSFNAVYHPKVNVGELLQANAPILGWNFLDVVCKLRPTETDVAALGPEFQRAWDTDFKNKPDKPVTLLCTWNGAAGAPETFTENADLTIFTYSAHPYSRGHVHITGPKLSDVLDFETGYFSDPDSFDIKVVAWAYKKQREIVRRMAHYRGEAAATHPPFPAESKAACREIDAPLQGDVVDIEYSAEDDDILYQFLREKVATAWHSLGTCKMGPREEGGVVDANLGVYGVKALKIADLSILPGNVAANTNNTALALGEKAADIFIKELGLGAPKVGGK